MILLWYIFSVWIKSPLILPCPKDVLFSMKKLLFLKSFYVSVFFTMKRAFISFFISFFLGQILGFLCGYYSNLKSFFSIPLSIIRITPVVSIILMAMFIFTSNSVPVFVSVLMSLPIIVTSVCTGFSKIDKKELDVAKIYKLSKIQTFKYVTLPSVKPFIFSGLLSSWGLTWKVVVAGEVLCLPKNSIGFLLENSQVHLETATVFALTIILILISCILEKTFSVFLNLFTGKRNEERGFYSNY